MKKVICFGEALIDFLNTANEVHDGLNIPVFNQFPGGAPANAAVAVAKLGGSAFFAGQVGDDTFGHYLKDALSRYGVNTKFTLFHPSAKTALAFVSLDTQGERSFSFCRSASADLLVNAEQFPSDLCETQDILHLCSNTLTTNEIANTTFSLASVALQNNAIVSVDVNLRHNLWDNNKADKYSVNQLLSYAKVIKFSKEELDYLSNKSEREYLQQLFAQNRQCQLILVTDGANPVRYFSRDYAGQVDVPPTTVSDTTCGGDSFIGGFLFCLSSIHNTKGIDLDEDSLQRFLKFSIACGAHTVAKQGAFPALPKLADVSKHFPFTDKSVCKEPQ
ncbi:carbohydrate kinase family protein [Agaribacter flavus]|uniref:Carbohydrate kinase n=1 Tax=Agaribacter flavus TaxID=1902781 RepID=A0ABV7FP42_9ALTE